MSDNITVGQVVTDKFTGLLLTVTQVHETTDTGETYLHGEFVERDDVGTQTRELSDVSV